MILLTYIFSVVLFVLAFYFSGLASSFEAVMSVVHDSLNTIRDRGLTDLEKEKRTQKSAIKLIQLVLFIGLKSTIVVLVTMMPIFLAEIAFSIPSSETIDFSLRAEVLLGTTVFMLVGWGLFRLLRKSRLGQD